VPALIAAVACPFDGIPVSNLGFGHQRGRRRL